MILCNKFTRASIDYLSEFITLYFLRCSEYQVPLKQKRLELASPCSYKDALIQFQRPGSSFIFIIQRKFPLLLFQQFIYEDVMADVVKGLAKS